MLHSYIGDDAFRKGMKDYLSKHSYKNTQTADLWASLEMASGKPVAKVMSTWTGQMGFPVIRVQSKMDGANNKVVTLTQEKFSADGSKASGDYMWRVPISILTSKRNLTEPAPLLHCISGDKWLTPRIQPLEWSDLHYLRSNDSSCTVLKDLNMDTSICQPMSPS